jgi:hypothetical protein
VAESTGSFTNQSTRDGATARKEKKENSARQMILNFLFRKVLVTGKSKRKTPFSCDIRAIRSL